MNKTIIIDGKEYFLTPVEKEVEKVNVKKLDFSLFSLNYSINVIRIKYKNELIAQIDESGKMYCLLDFYKKNPANFEDYTVIDFKKLAERFGE